MRLKIPGRGSRALSKSRASRSLSSVTSAKRASATASFIARECSGRSGGGPGGSPSGRSGGSNPGGIPTIVKPSFPCRRGHFRDRARLRTLSGLMPSCLAASSYVRKICSIVFPLTRIIPPEGRGVNPGMGSEKNKGQFSIAHCLRRGAYRRSTSHLGNKERSKKERKASVMRWWGVGGDPPH